MLDATQQHLENISGVIERITYHNEENGYVVLRVKVQKHKNLVTVIGTIGTVSVGEDLYAQGLWHNNTEYGLEFKAKFIRCIQPHSVEGMEKYLGSGLIKGIGPHFAKMLVQTFKESVFDIIEASPNRLTEVEGIGKIRVEKICKNWHEQKVVREIITFLQSNGISTSRASRIYKTYGDKSIQIVSKDPYRLAKDIRGIGFLSADKIAKNLGIEENSIIRAKGVINYVLTEGLNNGHCALPKKVLFEKTKEYITIASEILEEGIDAEITDSYLKKDTIDNEECVFLSSYYFYEKNIAFKLKLLLKTTNENQYSDLLKQIDDSAQNLQITLHETQKEALHKSLSSKVSIITGGPGTGKTTILKCLLDILKRYDKKVKLCAPTGRAAKKLFESTNHEASTIHRLLKYDPGRHDFKYNQNNQMDCDYLIVDEMSMVDVGIMHSLLKALNEKSNLILVGDIDQLPSVGAGNILRDMIDSDIFLATKLTQIFRQAQESDIITNAHLVNKGLMPKCKPKGIKSDFYFMEIDEPEKIAITIRNIVQTHIPKKLKYHPIKNIQVLCPMQKGKTGVRLLNTELQKALNPAYNDGVEKYGYIFAVNDKVMQIENNYDKDVFNGDIGFVIAIDKEEQELVVDFDGRTIKYDFADLDELVLAYASTIHKAQGSEYKAVVIPISMSDYMMLKKNLLYTGITRSKELCILVGQKKALYVSVKKKMNELRYTKLREFLVG